MKINPSIFREYDVRGEYPKEINEKTAYKIGQGLVKFLNLKNGDEIVLGKDKRPSSPKLSRGAISGILDSGIDVIDIGTVETPMLYFAAVFLKTKGGVMITASHNAQKFNGMKFVRGNADPISGKEIKQTLGVDKKTPSVKKGLVKKFDIKNEYRRAVFKDFVLPQKTGISASFDFDADRLIIKDERKREIRGDIIGGIIADAVTKKGDIVVYDLRCTHAIPEYLRNKGVVVLPSQSGHFFIKKLMRKKGAKFGLEITNHYFFKEFHYCEAPLYGFRKLIEQIKKEGKNIHELAKPFTKYTHSGIINFRLKSFDQFDKILNNLKEKYKNGSQDFMDGLTIEFSNWWFNIQLSHTEPIIRLVIETKDQKNLEQKKKELIQEIKKF